MSDLIETNFPKARLRKFAIAAAVLVLLFVIPLWQWASFAANDELYSYVLIIPFVCGYLAWLEKKNLPRDFQPALRMMVFLSATGLGALGFLFFRPPLFPEDRLALAMLAFVFFLAAEGCFFLGAKMMRALAFPFALLIFMAPFPVFLRDGIEAGLQHGSAILADGMFRLSGLPVFRDGMNFQLPGMRLQVAPECSGIHSTVVLFITALIAGKMILQQPWKRAVLALAVVPLALLRNGFRVFVIGQLCVRVGPHMIDSPIHHRGGPIFFGLSLIPFFLLLYYLKKSERPAAPKRP